MSLLNVVVGDGIAWLCVDTNSRSVAGDHSFQQSKMVSLAHHSAVIACRGELSFLAHVFLNCFLTPEQDFDSLLESWRRRLAEATAGYLQMAEANKWEAAAVGHEVVLLGWSNTRGQPVCLAARRQSAKDEFETTEVTCRIAPAPGRKVSNLSNLSEMEALARDQVHAVRRDNPGEPIGGKLLLAEVSRGKVAFRELATLD
ncbi:hypothetical protein [Lysobacter sp. 22409]|uniref:hypothetical protein n=1 Tax=Lysobacter sp. 22409 TaxID=3453917 RepID=UPI003F8674CB